VSGDSFPGEIDHDWERDNRVDRDFEREPFRTPPVVTIDDQLERSALIGRCDHAAIKLDDARWSSLRFDGLQQIEADDIGPAETLECRTCHCGSSLARTVKP
jgi:hypothetical protein